MKVRLDQSRERMLSLRISLEELRNRLKLNNTRECLQDSRLQWFGHLERMKENARSSKRRTLKVSVSLHRGRPWETRNEVIRRYLKQR